MLPAVIGGTLVAGAAAQYLNSEQARKASASERRRLEALIAKLQTPNFDTSALTPEEYQIAAVYAPEVAAYIEERAPELVTASSDAARAGREAEMRALDRYRNLSETGDDTESRFLRNEALRAAQVQNQGAQGAIQDSFARRGMAGSGMEMVAAQMAQQGAAQNAALGGEQAAMAAYNRRLSALRDAASLGGKIRGDEVDLEAMNTARINDYNQRFAANRNAYNQYAAGVQNDAQRFNVTNAQNVANLNTSQNNAYAQRYQDNRNHYAQQTFQNDLNKIGVQTGQGQAAINDIRQNAADRNAAISGAGGAITTTLGYLDNKDERQKDREAMAAYGTQPRRY